MDEPLRPDDNLSELEELLAEIEAGAARQLSTIRSARRLIGAAGSDVVDGFGDYVDEHGHIAHLHLKVIEANSKITLGESLEIRRSIYGPNVQGSASLFGVRDSNSLLYRDVAHGTPRADNQEVKLTETGLRVAQMWRDEHPDGETISRPSPSDEWEQYRGRYNARPETFEAYVDVWTRMTPVKDRFKGWAVFSQFANAEPKRVAESDERVREAESAMRSAGYEIGEPTKRGARRWVRRTNPT